MPRVLLLLPTSTYRTAPFLKAAEQIGVDVTVGSERANTMSRFNPAALLTLPFCDIPKTLDRVIEFAATYPIDAVIGVDDQVTEVAAAVGKALALPHNTVEAIRAATNKHSMRLACHQAGVPNPGFQRFRFDDDQTDVAESVDFPCVVKPLGLSGSRGVIRANDKKELHAAIGRLASICQSATAEDVTLVADQFLIEQFVAGPEVAVEGLLRGGEFQLLAIFDKPDPLDGPFFEETIYVTPSRLPEAAQQQIADCAAAAARALGLREGPIHAEIRLSNSGPVVIEVNPRSIGGQCSDVLRFGTGMTLEELIIRHALDPIFTPPALLHQASGVMMIPIPQAGTLRAVHGVDAAAASPNIKSITISARPGEALVPLPEGSTYLGFLFARAESPAEVEDSLRQAHGKLRFDVE